jgi:exonuclease III
MVSEANMASFRPKIASEYLLDAKHKTHMGCWNVRTLFIVGNPSQVGRETRQYRIEILEVSECRCNGYRSNKLATGETILYSGHQKEETEHTRGAASILQDKATSALIDWEPISERLIKARFKSKFNNITIINAYAPTNNASQENKDSFYEYLQTSVDKVHNRDTLIVMGTLTQNLATRIRGKNL